MKKKLFTCANYYGYEPDGRFHDSLEDVKAILYSYYKIEEEKEKSLDEEIELEM